MGLCKVEDHSWEEFLILERRRGCSRPDCLSFMVPDAGDDITGM